MATTPINFADLEQRYNLPRNLLQTVMMAESGGNPNAVSPKGAVGAFQFMPKTAQQYGIDPRDAVQSANAAAQMLSQLNTKYKGDMPSVLAGYNWGQGNVDRKGLGSMPTETRNYIGKIMPKIQVASSGQSAIDSLPEGFTLDALQGDIPPPPDGFTLDSLPDVTIRPDQMPQMPADAVSQQPDFYQRVGQRMLERGQNVGKQIVQGATGQQGMVETGFNTLGNAAGLLFDVGLEGAKSAFGALPNAVQQPVKSAGRYVAESPVGVAGGEAIAQAGEWAQENPRASSFIGSAFNLSGLPLAGRAGQATANVVKPIAEVTAERIAPVLQKAKPAAKLEPLNQDIVRQAGSNAYKYVMDTGTTFSPQGVNRILDVLESKRQKGSFGGKVVTKEQAAINEAIDEFMPARGSMGTIEDIQKLDSQLGDKAAMAYTSGDFNKGRIFSNLQDDVRDALRKENTKAGDIIGSREGVDVLMNDAIPLWATQAKLGDIQKIIDRANVMDNPTTAIRTGFRNLMLNKNKFNQYPKEVQAMIKDAADTGVVDDLMGIIGSRLNPIIGLAGGGVKQAIVNNVVSKGARSVRDKMRMNKVNKIIEEMVKDVRPSVERFRNMPEAPKQPPKLLEYKPKPTDIQVGAQGAKKLSVAEQMKLNKARANKESLGGKVDRFTPEQRKLLDGIQRGTDGKVRIAPVAPATAPVAKPVPQVKDFYNKPTQRIASFSDKGRPTSLYTFIRNNGGLRDTGGDVASMGHKELINSNGISIDSLGEKLQQYGFFEGERPTTAQILKLIEDTNGGRKAYRPADIDRIMTAQENAAAKAMNDPDYIEYTASNMGIDTQGKTTQQLLKAIEAKQKELDDIPFDMPEGGKLKSFLKDESGSVGRAVTDTPEFKRWFGDSKVVDAEGKPLVVYHGTTANFDVFNKDKIKNKRGFWFAENPDWASKFSQASRGGEKIEGSNVMPIFLNIKNPYIHDPIMPKKAGMNMDDIFKEAKKGGHDGIRFYSKSGGADTWVAFSPTQIKSIHNRGTFDPKDPRILFNMGGTGAAIPLGAAGAGATYYQNQSK